MFDLARGLLDAGHRPVIYSPSLGAVAAAARARSIPVVDDLDRVGEAPDVIHGHHHLPTAVALLHFPSVPAIFVCHGWTPWQEAPLLLSRVRRYVAIDELCRERLVAENGVDPGTVHLLPNFVDLERFLPRAALPVRPARALIYSNYVAERHAAAVRQACATRGISVDIVGRASGRPTAEPEKLLAAYDLVFAKGRSALEALAVGAAVVLFDVEGLGPLVTSADLARLRRANFGRATLTSRAEADAIARRIQAYDPADATSVSSKIRAEVGLDRAVDQLLALYTGVLSEPDREGPGPFAELREVEAYLGSLSSLLADLDALRSRQRGADLEREAWRDEQRLLLEDRERLRATLAESQADRVATTARRIVELESTLAGSRGETEGLGHRVRRLEDELERVTTSRAWRARAALLSLPGVARLVRWSSRRSLPG